MSGREKSATYGEILHAIGRLEGTMATFIAASEQRIGAVEAKQAVHDAALGDLRSRQAWWAGAAAAIGAGIGLVIDLMVGEIE